MLQKPLSWTHLWQRHICARGESGAVLETGLVCRLSLSERTVANVAACSIACFHLEEYEAAKQAFDAGAKLTPDQTQFKTWIRKCQAEIDGAFYALESRLLHGKRHACSGEICVWVMG